MTIRLKRVYEKPERSDGVRILVDRLWPRGLAKDEVALDEWLTDIAPSNRLRIWFGHKTERWSEFQRRYRRELTSSEKKTVVARLKRIARISTVTLLYASKDTERNNAVALAGFLAGKHKQSH